MLGDSSDLNINENLVSLVTILFTMKNGLILNLEIFGILQYLNLGIICPRMMVGLGIKRVSSYYLSIF